MVKSFIKIGGWFLFKRFVVEELGVPDLDGDIAGKTGPLEEALLAACHCNAILVPPKSEWRPLPFLAVKGPLWGH